MKISWGIKIAILYGGFVALIVFMIMLTMREKVDLVSDDYYERELMFQEHIDRKRAASELDVDVKWNLEGRTLNIQFPELDGKPLISGEILLFCPSDKLKDIHISIQNDTAPTRSVKLENASPGAYKLQLDWQTAQDKFYTEGNLNIN